MSAGESVMPGRALPWAAAREMDWEALYSRELPRVYNFFRYRVGNEADAQELTSETFLRAWSARERYRRDLAGFSTWLFTIARRLHIDHHRRWRPLVPLDAAADVAAGPTPLEDAERRSDAGRLARLLERLEDRERELVALKYGAGLTHREIGRLTGLTETNVGTILHRTVESLRSAWEEQGEP
jgi:RNA polymerase sigma-70 factor (ECF subfamily)